MHTVYLRNNFTLKSGGDQWRRQDLLSGGHNDRGAEGVSIKAPKAPSGVGYGKGCPLPSRLGCLGELGSGELLEKLQIPFLKKWW